MHWLKKVRKLIWFLWERIHLFKFIFRWFDILFSSLISRWYNRKLWILQCSSYRWSFQCIRCESKPKKSGEMVSTWPIDQSPFWAQLWDRKSFVFSFFISITLLRLYMEWESNIFKLHINSSRPTQVIIFNKTEIDACGWRFGGGCGGIYVNSIDEIFIFSTYNGKLTKWTANKTRGILVADGRRCDSITSTSYSFQQAVIDEKNDLIYILDGTAIFDPVANEIFSNDEIKYLDIRSIVVICYPRDCSD